MNQKTCAACDYKLDDNAIKVTQDRRGVLRGMRDEAEGSALRYGEPRLRSRDEPVVLVAGATAPCDRFAAAFRASVGCD